MSGYPSKNAAHHPPRITAIAPLPSDPNRCSIRVDGRVVGRLRATDIDRLDLAVGAPWTTATRREFEQTVAQEHAYRMALQLLSQSDRSAMELQQRLVGRGVEDDIANRVIAELTEQSWIDDYATALDFARRLTQRQAAGPALVRRKLAARGFNDDVIESALNALAESVQGGTPATDWASKKLAQMKNQPKQTRVRRIAAGLTRRGFDEETIVGVLDELGLRIETS